MKNGIIIAIGIILVCAAFFAGAWYEKHSGFSAMVEKGRAGYEQAHPSLPRPNSWMVNQTKDEISDQLSWYMMIGSNERGSIMDVSCGKGIESVTFTGDDFFPGADADGDTYYVSYRFDEKPGVKLERWPGMRRYANPPDIKVFLQEAATSKQLRIGVSSTVMDSSSTAAQLQTFDLTGFAAALTELRSKCETARAT